MKPSKNQIETRIQNLKNNNSEVQRNRRVRQLKTEQMLSNKLREDGWEIFSPTVVCDRVGIKNGKIFFIEFKKHGQDLREGQRKIKEMMPENYKIVYH